MCRQMGKHSRSREELEHEDPQGPVVGRDVVTPVQDDLGSDILGGAAERPRLAAVHQLLGKAKVHLEGEIEESFYSDSCYRRFPAALEAVLW